MSHVYIHCNRSSLARFSAEAFLIWHNRIFGVWSG